MNNTYYGKLIFELSKKGRIGYSLPNNEFKDYHVSDLSDCLLRKSETILPEADEQTVARHYTNMSNNNFGVDTGFYPLGSCTMKYNPKINEEMAALPAFNLHPEQPADSVQGALEVYYNVQKMLSEISGLSEFTLNPYAGAHGELTGLMVIRTYHMKVTANVLRLSFPTLPMERIQHQLLYVVWKWLKLRAHRMVQLTLKTSNLFLAMT